MSLPYPFTPPRASLVSHCWRPSIGEPCLTCCVCSFMLCKLLVVPGSDLLRDSSTAEGVSSDLQLFCISKSGLSSKPGSIRDWDVQGFRSTHMKWELTWVLGYQKSSLNTVWGLFCKMEPQNQTCLEVSCPWATSGLPHRWHISVVPLGKQGEHWQWSLRDCCFEEAGTHSSSCADWVRGCQRRAWGKSEVCYGWCACEVCLPLLPLSSPNLL